MANTLANAMVTTRTVVPVEVTGPLRALSFEHPPGTFAPTPATMIALRAVAQHWHVLEGTGLDWGSGVGCLAIAAAKIPAVRLVVGLEIVPANVGAARQNATLNGVAERVSFLKADSFDACDHEGRAVLQTLEGRARFILANPPSSSPDGDGFEYRRVVLRGAHRFLEPGGIVFLNISEQYGSERVLGLTRLAPAFRHDGVLATTDYVAFDMTRPDLLLDVETYAAEERRGGSAYAFRNPVEPARPMTAVEALAQFRRTGQSPLSRWQVHRFTYLPP
jgi:SAM-dependent methyltransferase